MRRITHSLGMNNADITKTSAAVNLHLCIAVEEAGRTIVDAQFVKPHSDEIISGVFT